MSKRRTVKKIVFYVGVVFSFGAMSFLGTLYNMASPEKSQ